MSSVFLIEKLGFLEISMEAPAFWGVAKQVACWLFHRDSAWRAALFL